MLGTLSTVRRLRFLMVHRGAIVCQIPMAVDDDDGSDNCDHIPDDYVHIPGGGAAVMNPTFLGRGQQQQQQQQQQQRPSLDRTEHVAGHQSTAPVGLHVVPSAEQPAIHDASSGSPPPGFPADLSASTAAWLKLSLTKAETVEALLGAGLDLGTFCFRNGSTGTVLCVLLSTTNVGHFRIVERACDGQIELPDVGPCAGMVFRDVQEALAHLRANPTAVRGQNLVLTDLVPASNLIDVGPTVTLTDLASTLNPRTTDA